MDIDLQKLEKEIRDWFTSDEQITGRTLAMILKENLATQDQTKSDKTPDVDSLVEQMVGIGYRANRSLTTWEEYHQSVSKTFKKLLSGIGTRPKITDLEIDEIVIGSFISSIKKVKDSSRKDGTAEIIMGYHNGKSYIIDYVYTPPPKITTDMVTIQLEKDDKGIVVYAKTDDKSGWCRFEDSLRAPNMQSRVKTSPIGLILSEVRTYPYPGSVDD